MDDTSQVIQQGMELFQVYEGHKVGRIVSLDGLPSHGWCHTNDTLDGVLPLVDSMGSDDPIGYVCGPLLNSNDRDIVVHIVGSKYKIHLTMDVLQQKTTDSPTINLAIKGTHMGNFIQLQSNKLMEQQKLTWSGEQVACVLRTSTLCDNYLYQGCKMIGVIISNSDEDLKRSYQSAWVKGVEDSGKKFELRIFSRLTNSGKHDINSRRNEIIGSVTPLVQGALRFD